MRPWAIIGLGFISPRHRKSIEAIGDEVVVTCDIDPAKGADFTDFDRMRQSNMWKRVTHVAVCSPNDLHYSFIQKATEDKKLVLCEKPLVLSSKQCKKLHPTVGTVLQLRYHPSVLNLSTLSGTHDVALIVKVKRDPSYWAGWKGDSSRSGGIMFNLGIHYFDLLVHLFGDDYTVLNSEYDPRKATGTIDFNGTRATYHIEIMDDNAGQTRSLTIDGKEIVLSKQDNLSFEDLHTKVYEDFVCGKNITPMEAARSIRLVEELKR